MITMSDMDETFRKYLPDIPFGIAITIQNKIRMIHFKHKKIFYREILRALSKSTQLRVTDWTETFRNCLWYTRDLITCLYRHFEGLHSFQTQENIFKAKIIIVESKLKKSKLRFFCHDLSRKNLRVFSTIWHWVSWYLCPICIVLIILYDVA